MFEIVLRRRFMWSKRIDTIKKHICTTFWNFQKLFEWPGAHMPPTMWATWVKWMCRLELETDITNGFRLDSQQSSWAKSESIQAKSESIQAKKIHSSTIRFKNISLSVIKSVSMRFVMFELNPFKQKCESIQAKLGWGVWYTMTWTHQKRYSRLGFGCSCLSVDFTIFTKWRFFKTQKRVLQPMSWGVTLKWPPKLLLFFIHIFFRRYTKGIQMNCERRWNMM